MSLIGESLIDRLQLEKWAAAFQHQIRSQLSGHMYWPQIERILETVVASSDPQDVPVLIVLNALCDACDNNTIDDNTTDICLSIILQFSCDNSLLRECLREIRQQNRSISMAEKDLERLHDATYARFCVRCSDFLDELADDRVAVVYANWLSEQQSNQSATQSTKHKQSKKQTQMKHQSASPTSLSIAEMNLLLKELNLTVSSNVEMLSRALVKTLLCDKDLMDLNKRLSEDAVFDAEQGQSAADVTNTGLATVTRSERIEVQKRRAETLLKKHTASMQILTKLRICTEEHCNIMGVLNSHRLCGNRHSSAERITNDDLCNVALSLASLAKQANEQYLSISEFCVTMTDMNRAEFDRLANL